MHLQVGREKKREQKSFRWENEIISKEDVLTLASDASNERKPIWREDFLNDYDS